MKEGTRHQVYPPVIACYAYILPTQARQSIESIRGYIVTSPIRINPNKEVILIKSKGGDKMYKIVEKHGDICEVLDTDDGVVETCSISELVDLFFRGISVEGFDFDTNSLFFHVDIDSSDYEKIIVDRVERHQITDKHPYYAILNDYCFRAKNLYNHANYIHRQDLVEGYAYSKYTELYKELRDDKEYPDFDSMPTYHSAIQVLRRLDKNWSSFFSAMRDYNNNPDKYTGRPKPPKYLDKSGRFVLEIPSSEIHSNIINNRLSFNKHFKGFQVETRCHRRKGFAGVSEVRIVPQKGYLIIEVCYKLARF